MAATDDYLKRTTVRPWHQHAASPEKIRSALINARRCSGPPRPGRRAPHSRPLGPTTGCSAAPPTARLRAAVTACGSRLGSHLPGRVRDLTIGVTPATPIVRSQTREARCGVTPVTSVTPARRSTGAAESQGPSDQFAASMVVGATYIDHVRRAMPSLAPRGLAWPPPAPPSAVPWRPARPTGARLGGSSAQGLRDVELRADRPPHGLGVHAVRQSLIDGPLPQRGQDMVLGDAARVRVTELRPHPRPELAEPHGPP